MKGMLSVFAILALLLYSGTSTAGWLNIKLNQDTTTELQNEEQIAINPANPDNMVAVWRDFRLGYRQVGWAYTFDGGATWAEGGLLYESNYPWQSDPGVTVDSDGNFYAIILSYISVSEPNGLYVLKSTDGGVSWGPSLEVINGVTGAFEDKEFIACDRTGGMNAGNLYVTWTRFDTSTRILLRRSTNSGVSWSSTVNISDQESVQFPIPVVGRQGEVYVAWTGYNQSVIKIDVSTNGGLTFGVDRTVENVFTPSTTLNGGVHAYSSPHMDADITDGPFSGRLYVAFMDRRQGLPDFDIWGTSSDNNGVSWSTPIRINDDIPGNGRDQFHPWLAVDNLGIVTVVFLDRRHDPSNLTYHCYLTQSYNGGATWSANVQVSTAPSNPDYALTGSVPIGASFEISDESAVPRMSIPLAGLLGEYIGVVSWDGRPTPIWTDIRNLNQDVFAGHLDSETDVVETELPRMALRLYATPNPSSRNQMISIYSHAGGPSFLSIYDVTGRIIRELKVQNPAGETVTFHWDGLLVDGRPANSGIYFLKARTPQGIASGKLVLLD